jgi:integrase
MLTTKKADKLIRNGVPGRHFDTQGLYLVVAGPKAAHWERRYQVPGAQPKLSRNGKRTMPSRYVGLGSARVFTLQEARERNRALSKLLADGIDPLLRKREERAAEAARAATAKTFGEVAEDHFRAEAPGWKHRNHAAQFLGTVLGRTPNGRPSKADYCRSLRPLPVQAIGVAQVLAVLQPIWHRHPETASRVRARIHAVLDRAKVSGLRSGDNPASWDLISNLLPARAKIAPVKNFARLPYKQVPGFLAELRGHQGSAARALEFQIHCAVRPTEAREAVWSEIDLEEKLWVIPPSRMKNGKEHRVPLTDPMLDLLRALPREDGSPFLFLGHQPGRPLSDAALVSLMKRMGRHGEATPHGFRSSFSDFAHERAAARDIVIELSLAHAVGSSVARSYRRTDLLKWRRRLMGQWSAFLTNPALAGNGKVTPIRAQVTP